MVLPTAEKVKENRFRRVLARRGFMLRRSKRRDEEALDYGGYWIDRADDGLTVAGGEHGISLKEVETWIARNKRRRER